MSDYTFYIFVNLQILKKLLHTNGKSHHSLEMARKNEKVNTAPTIITETINPIMSTFGLTEILLNSRMCPHFEHVIWSPFNL